MAKVGEISLIDSSTGADNMALFRKPPASVCAVGVGRVLGCFAVLALLAAFAKAEIMSYDSWQWNGFSRTVLPSSPSSAPVSLLASILLASWSSDNIQSEGSIVPPTETSTTAPSLSGSVYFDANYNGVRDESDWAIRDAVISLTAASTNTVLIATTDKNGEYSFTSLTADDYTITLLTVSSAPGVTNEGFLTDANGADVFTGTGVAVGQSIANIQLKDGYKGVAYDFGQYTYPTSLVSKRMLLNQDPGPSHTPPAPPPPIPPVPEPGTLTLLVVAGLCVTGLAWRRRS
jgi:hypothetical protein